MTSLSRRDFARRAAAFFLVGTSLLSCTQAQTAQWIAAEQALGQEFTVVSPELAALGVSASAPVTIPSTTVGGVTVPAVTTSVAGLAALVGALTSALGAASSASEGQTVLIRVETYVNALVPVIWPVVGPFVT